MDIGARRVMANLFYYTLAAVIIAFSILFIVALNTRPAVATYQMVVYTIWAVIVILVVIADIWATLTNRSKYVIGLVIYGLALLFLLMGFIVFAAYNTNGVIPTGSYDLFSTLVYFSLGLTVALIVLYIVGLRVDRLTHDEV